MAGNTVLVVDDERGLTDLYAKWLSDDEFDVRTAYDGREAIEGLDESVGAVLLDRRMPDLSGDEVLEEIRSRDLNCRVAMVTAVEPDFDIIDMGFDDYVVKPVSREELVETTESMLRRRDHDDRVREYYSLLSKRAALEDEKTEGELADSAEYEQLDTRIESLEEEVDGLVNDFDQEDFDAEFKRFAATEEPE
jgi:DNA-binding response OmpR family regulator